MGAKQPGGYARAAQVHNQRRRRPDRRNHLLRQAATACNLDRMIFEYCIVSSDGRAYWYDIYAKYHGQHFLIDLKVKKTNARDREIRVEKDRLAAQLGIPLLVIQDDSLQATMQGEIEVFKLRLSALKKDN